MKKDFTRWCNALIFVAILSFIFPFISLAAIILLFAKKKYYAAAFESIESADDAINYSAKIRKNADEYLDQKMKNANEYERNKRRAGDEYLKNKQEYADRYAAEQKANADRCASEHKSNTERYQQEISALEAEKSDLINEIAELSKKSMEVAIDFTVDETITSEEYKNKLAILKKDLSDLVKSGTAVLVDPTLKAKVIRDNSKQIIRCFESEGDAIIKAVTVKNVDSQRGKLVRSFEALNRIFAVDGVELDKKVLELKLDALNVTYAFQLRQEQEREEQKAIREQMLEEEKVRREIEREKSKIEKEEHHFKNEISKLMGYLQKASEIEKQLYIDKINELEEKLKLVEKDKENVLEREQNTRAGYVYIISNIGSFGEDIYKIGMTRRLEPLDRVKELGDASVPFEFDVHAMIFSEDAPALETALHNTFRSKQVNKVNPRKEFFHVTLPEIEKVVKENHNAAVTFTQIAKAEQYRESLKLAEVQ